jgi:hypothetical protein
MSTPSKLRTDTERTEAAQTAAAFIRDLHYNAPLRTAYFEARNQPGDDVTSTRAKKKIDEVMTRFGYKCLSDDLVDGWDSEFWF